MEGWSAIGKWTGVPLAQLLNQAELQPEARYLVLHCADDFSGTAYYESIDLIDAFHPQTILAYAMNDADLAVGHGAPLRLRVERQLGYKQAKYVMRVEAVASLPASARGRAASGRIPSTTTGTPASDASQGEAGRAGRSPRSGGDPSPRLAGT